MLNLLNNYLHDLSSACWFVIVIVAWFLYQEIAREGSETAFKIWQRFFGKANILFCVSLVLVMVSGVFRAIYYQRMEWVESLGTKQVYLLLMKHLFFAIMVFSGIFVWHRLARRRQVKPSVLIWIGLVLLLLMVSFSMGWKVTENKIKIRNELLLFHAMPLSYFYHGETGKNLEELNYKRTEGRYGWAIPCNNCQFDGKKGFVEDCEVGNFCLIPFEGREVLLWVGMDFYGDQYKVTIDPGEKDEIDAGWINTCANAELKEAYQSDREPMKRIIDPNKPLERFTQGERYIQVFKIHSGLKQGKHILRLEHIWREEIDSGGHDFNHLYAVETIR